MLSQGLSEQRTTKQFDANKRRAIDQHDSDQQLYPKPAGSTNELMLESQSGSYSPAFLEEASRKPEGLKGHKKSQVLQSRY